MRFFLLSLLFLVKFENSCIASEVWKNSIGHRELQSKIFIHEVEKVFRKNQILTLFSIQNEKQAAIFFADDQMKGYGAIILHHDQGKAVVGGISEFVTNDIKIRNQIMKIFGVEHSRYELLIEKAYADNCQVSGKSSSFEKLKAVMTEQEKNSYFSFAAGCGRGIIEGSISGSFGSAQAIFDLVRSAATLSGPEEAWQKIKNIPLHLVSIMKDFRNRLSEVLGNQMVLPPDITGNLMCAFISEFGVRAMIATLTGGGGILAITEAIKAFTAKIGKIARSFGEGHSFKKSLSQVSEKYRYVFSKLDSNISIPNARFDEKNLGKHFKKHQNDIGVTSESEYAKKAHDLAGASDNDILMIKGPKSEAIFKYKPSTNEFIVISKSGVIETYFKPHPAKHGMGTNLEYFLSQYEKY